MKVKRSLKERPCELVDPGFQGNDKPFVTPHWGGIGGNGFRRYMLTSELVRTKDRDRPFKGRIPFIDGQGSRWDIPSGRFAPDHPSSLWVCDLGGVIWACWCDGGAGWQSAAGRRLECNETNSGSRSSRSSSPLFPARSTGWLGASSKSIIIFSGVSGMTGGSGWVL